MPKDNTAYTTYLYARQLKLKITESSIGDELRRHPNPGSLSAISDVFNNWNVPNTAFKATVKELETLPLPFIALLTSNKGEFVLVEDISAAGYTVSNERLKKHTISVTEFKEAFKHIVLLAEAGDASGEPDYSKKRRKEFLEKARLPFVLLFLSFMLAIKIYEVSEVGAPYLYISALIGLKIAGVVVSVFLLTQSLNFNSPVIERLCSFAGAGNCNKILASDAAKLTDEVSWAEVGFFYFAGSLLSVLGGHHSAGLFQLLVIINLLSLPYTFYSIYYQAKIARQWCIFCCAVQLLLWLEFSLFAGYLFPHRFVASLTDAYTILIAFLAPVSAWIFIKPYLTGYIAANANALQAHKIKYNSKLFQKALAEQKQYNMLDESDMIVFGNLEAENVITMVSNPYCQPCAATHKLFEQWINGLENIKVQVVFFIQKAGYAPQAAVANHLMNLSKSADQELVSQAISSWYAQKEKKYPGWASAYPLAATGTNNDSLSRQQEWCSLAGIRATPTIFINGKKLPGPWRAEDIKYLL